LEQEDHLLKRRSGWQSARVVMIAHTAPAPAAPARGVDRAPTVAVAVPGVLMAEAFGRVLREAGMHVVGCYGTLPTLLDKVRRCRPAVVIADAGLGDDPSGAAALLWQVREAGPASKVVVLAADVDAPLARAVMQYGVQAVILKTSPMGDAVQVLQHVADGRTSFPPTLLERLTERPDTRGLSTRQLEVLEELAKGRSTEEIARRLFISTNTVKFHLRAIYDRLGVHNRVEAAQLLSRQRVV
jgi:DNA-binding NarL/FixJ family response regulator